VLALNSPQAPGQHGWRWCNKCQGLAFDGGSACPVGGAHTHQEINRVKGRREYGLNLVPDLPIAGGQHEWTWCVKCSGLVFAGHTQAGPCPAGGTHSHSGGDYALPQLPFDDALVPYQDRWGWCNKCQELTFTGNDVPGGNPHPPLGSCPAGGTHDHTGGGDYWLTSATEANLPFLVTMGNGNLDWQPGQTFSDRVRNLFIRVETIDASPEVNLAMITIGRLS
jgi:hypothetical protein